MEPWKFKLLTVMPDNGLPVVDLVAMSTQAQFIDAQAIIPCPGRQIKTDRDCSMVFDFESRTL